MFHFPKIPGLEASPKDATAEPEPSSLQLLSKSLVSRLRQYPSQTRNPSHLLKKRGWGEKLSAVFLSLSVACWRCHFVARPEALLNYRIACDRVLIIITSGSLGALNSLPFSLYHWLGPLLYSLTVWNCHILSCQHLDLISASGKYFFRT